MSAAPEQIPAATVRGADIGHPREPVKQAAGLIQGIRFRLTLVLGGRGIRYSARSSGAWCRGWPAPVSSGHAWLETTTPVAAFDCPLRGACATWWSAEASQTAAFRPVARAGAASCTLILAAYAAGVR
jgi:hypothetical protein